LNDLTLIGVEDLNDMQVAGRIEELDNVLARLEQRVSDLNGFVDCQYGLLISGVCLRRKYGEPGENREATKRGIT
jgi:hypothetical protein